LNSYGQFYNPRLPCYHPEFACAARGLRAPD
jgi:hypothetical protein